MAVSITANATYALMNWGSKMILDSNFINSTYYRTDACYAHIGIAPVANQEWNLIPTGNANEYYIKGVWDKLCVDLIGGSNPDSTMWGTVCSGKPTQKWVFTRVGGPDPKYCISNSASSLVAGVTANSTTGVVRCGYPVHGFTNNCNNDMAQQWELLPLDIKNW